MALFNAGMFSGGGILDGLFPEFEGGTGNRGGFLPQELESLLAQQARDRAAEAFRLRSRVGGKFDPSLLPDYQPPDKGLENFLNPAPPQGWMVQPSQPAPPAIAQPVSTPSLQWSAGASPFQFTGMSSGNMPQQQPPRDFAPNGLDRNMTSLPPQYAQMDATDPRNLPPGYAPSPSALDQIPTNARLAGPAQQASVPSPDVGFGDRLTSAFQGFTNAKSPMQALGNLVGGITTGQRTDPAGIAQQNTKQAFQGFQQLFLSRGLPPAQANSLAMIAATNPKVAEEILKAPTTMEGARVNPYLGATGGNNMRPVTGDKAVDTKFATDYAEWVTGGFADVQRNVSDLQEAKSILKSGQSISGPYMGKIPESLEPIANPEGLRVKQIIANVVQRNLRPILGAQFTENEGKRIIEQAYSPHVSEAENLRRLEALETQMKTAAAQKQAAVDWFKSHGTLEGFAGKLPSVSDFTFNAPTSNSYGSMPPPPKGFVPLNR